MYCLLRKHAHSLQTDSYRSMTTYSVPNKGSPQKRAFSTGKRDWGCKSVRNSKASGKTEKQQQRKRASGRDGNIDIDTGE